MPSKVRIILGVLVISNGDLNCFCVEVQKANKEKKAQNNCPEYDAKLIQFWRFSFTL